MDAPRKACPRFNSPKRKSAVSPDYLHSEAHLASTTYQRGPGEYPLDKLLVGNATAGKTYFETKCVQCHSHTSDLAHLATSTNQSICNRALLSPWGAVPIVTVTELSGKVFVGSQVYSDEFVISLRDKNNWIHTSGP